tara:strand:- start:901 stop:1368 length:468 start_codon:yes stop_codon:yes gene_type:complete
MAIRNTTWSKIEPGQIVTFTYKGENNPRPIRRTVLCINPEYRYRKKNGRTTKFFIGLQINTQTSKAVLPATLQRILNRLGGLEKEDGALGIDMKEDINKIETTKIVQQLRGLTNLYRTFNLRECKRKRVVLELDYAQIPKKEIKLLEGMAEINED